MAVGNGSRLVPGFKYLTHKIRRKNHRIFFRCGSEDHLSCFKRITAKRKVRTMLFDYTKRNYTNTTGFFNTASGIQALYTNTTGGDNTASGAFALAFNTTGSSNTASGNRPAA